MASGGSWKVALDFFSAEEDHMPASAAQKSKTKPKEPKAGRPIMPELYGMGKIKRGSMKWEDVGKQLEKSRNYWISTTRSDGRPHAMPVWGFWMDGKVLFGTGRETIKAKNIERNPHAVVHLESGDDVVIMECTVEEQPLTDKAFRKRIDALSQKKYKMPLMVVPESVLYRAKPTVVLAWREKDFPQSATRWVLK
jgi:hypothetical protein